MYLHKLILVYLRHECRTCDADNKHTLLLFIIELFIVMTIDDDDICKMATKTGVDGWHDDLSPT